MTLRKVTCRQCGKVANYADENGAAFAETLCGCSRLTDVYAVVPPKARKTTPVRVANVRRGQPSPEPSEITKKQVGVCPSDDGDVRLSLHYDYMDGPKLAEVGYACMTTDEARELARVLEGVADDLDNAHD